MNTFPAKSALLRRSLSELCILPLRYWFLITGLFTFLGLGVSPLIHRLLLAAVHGAELRALTDRNMAMLLSSEQSMGLLLTALILVAVATPLCFVTLLIIAELQLSEAPPSIAMVCSRLRRVFQKRYRGGAFLVAAQLGLVAPLVGFTLFAPVTGSLGIPPFIGREYMKTPVSALLWCSVAAFIVYGIYRTILTMPFSLVRRQRLSTSFRSSLRATRKGGIRLPLVFVVATCGAMLVNRLGASAMGWAVDSLDATMGNTAAAVTAANLAFGFLTVATAQGFAFLFMGAARDFVADDSLPGQLSTSVSVRAPKTRSRDIRKAMTSFVVLAVACTLGAATLTPAMAQDTVASPDVSQALIIGHRGYDSGGVENTIGGLEAAVTQRPDVVEVDFQQTADGGFVASHDTNLLLLAGINENIYEMSTSEVTSTIVSMKGHSDTIPTLSAYVTRARELNIPLLIELKVTGHEKAGFVQAFLDELEVLDALDGNWFHSLDPTVVETIKAQRPELRVGLTIGMLFGGLPATMCDFYVIEQASLTTSIIVTAHQRGRDVYAWTVNDEPTMRALLRGGIDGLVTDHPDTVQTTRGQLSPGPGYVPGDLHNALLLESRLRRP